jgi:hypothetical protein
MIEPEFNKPFGNLRRPMPAVSETKNVRAIEGYQLASIPSPDSLVR